MTARICIVICDHRNDTYLQDLIDGISRFCLRSDIAWYNSGSEQPHAGSAGMSLMRLPQSRPLEYAKVTPFFLDMFEWAAGRDYEYIVNAETDMAFVQPGFERFVAEAMKEADHLAPGSRAGCPPDITVAAIPQPAGRASWAAGNSRRHQHAPVFQPRSGVQRTLYREARHQHLVPGDTRFRVTEPGAWPLIHPSGSPPANSRRCARASNHELPRASRVSQPVPAVPRHGEHPPSARDPRCLLRSSRAPRRG